MDPLCPYRTFDGEIVNDAPDEIVSNLPVFTYDQIADQLTTGFWGGNTYGFDVGTDGLLTVDLAGLTQAGQEMARLALDAWTDASGIVFSEISTAAAAAVTAESADAGAGTSGGYVISHGDDFRGTLSDTADRDSVAVALTAGDRITLTVDPDMIGDQMTLRLIASDGTVLQDSTSAYGIDATIAYQVTSSGTYYIETSGAAAGGYTMSLRDVRASSEITFDDTSSGAFAQFWTSGGQITRSQINIDDNWAGGQSRIDGYFFQTYLHEIGHALGLGHAGNYNGSARYPTDADYLNDSWQASVMSYFYQTENTFIDASFAYAVTPQVADLIAIQNLYGPVETRIGDDTYGDGANTGTYVDDAMNLSNPVSYTVIDTGGVDTFDFRSFDGDQRLDLREEAFSDLGGLVGNIGIARGTVIEYGKTGSGDDVLVGNGAGNGLSSGDGSDTLDGGGGDDALGGASGSDRLDGGIGRDLVSGGADSDQIEGGDEADLLFGDDVDLATLIDTFPVWTPPPDAADRIAEGDLLSLWDDIVADVFDIA